MDEEEISYLEKLWNRFENLNPIWPALTFFGLIVALVFICAAKLDREDHWRPKDL